MAWLSLHKANSHGGSACEHECAVTNADDHACGSSSGARLHNNMCHFWSIGIFRHRRKDAGWHLLILQPCLPMYVLWMSVSLTHRVSGTRTDADSWRCGLLPRERCTVVGDHVTLLSDWYR